MELGRWRPGGKVHVMFLRKCLVLIVLLCLLAPALPTQASEPRSGFSQLDAFWQVFLQLLPIYGGRAPAPEKSDEDTGSGIDPSGLVIGPGQEPWEGPGGATASSAEEDPEGDPAIDPDGLVVGPGSGPWGNPTGATVSSSGEYPDGDPAIDPNGNS